LPMLRIQCKGGMSISWTPRVSTMEHSKRCDPLALMFGQEETSLSITDERNTDEDCLQFSHFDEFWTS
jgi:hypothetical protein